MVPYWGHLGASSGVLGASWSHLGGYRFLRMLSLSHYATSCSGFVPYSEIVEYGQVIFRRAPLRLRIFAGAPLERLQLVLPRTVQVSCVLTARPYYGCGRWKMNALLRGLTPRSSLSGEVGGRSTIGVPVAPRPWIPYPRFPYPTFS